MTVSAAKPKFFETITGQLVRPLLVVFFLGLAVAMPLRYWFSQVYVGGEFEQRARTTGSQLAEELSRHGASEKLQTLLDESGGTGAKDVAFVVDAQSGLVLASSLKDAIGLHHGEALKFLPPLHFFYVSRMAAYPAGSGQVMRSVRVELYFDRGSVDRTAEFSAVMAAAILTVILGLTTGGVAFVAWRKVQVPARELVGFINTYDESGSSGVDTSNFPLELREISAALKRSVGARLQKEAVLGEVLRNAADGILVIDESGIIENFNAAAERMFGYTPTEATGQNVTLIMPNPEAHQHTKAMERYRASGQSRDVVITAETRAKRRDGTVFPVKLSISEVRAGGKRRFAGIISDITSQHAARDKLVRTQKMLEDLRDAQTDFIANYDIKTLSHSLVSILLQSTGSGFGFIGEVLEQADGQPCLKAHALTNTAWSAETQKFHDQHHASGLELRNLQSLLGGVISSGEPVIANDVANDPSSSGLPDGLVTLSAFLGLPIKVGGKLVGMAGIANREGGYAAADVEMLTPFMLTAGNLILAFRSEMARRESQAALAAALETAEAANEAKSRFLATMSHEIRTPMNGVLGMLSALQQTALDAKQLDYAQTASASGHELLGLMNDILDLSKVEAGKMELERAPFGVADLARDTVHLFLPAAQAKGLEFSVELSPSVPARLTGDGSRIRQILGNLISNAVKFTQQGRVRLNVTAAQAGEGTVNLRFDVTDSGIGISAEQQARIFTRFSQGDSSITRKFGGTGLGLAICDEIAKLMGGTITCASEPGRGSCFSLVVPLPLAHEALPVAQAVSPEARQRARLRILVAEDVAVNQKLLRVFLEPLGHSIDIVSNGLEALAAVRRGGYDVVLMDVQMPEMDGLTATRHIRLMDGPARRIHVITLTANAMSGDRERCLEAGANDYVSKPIRMTELYAALDRVEVTVKMEPPVASGSVA